MYAERGQAPGAPMVDSAFVSCDGDSVKGTAAVVSQKYASTKPDVGILIECRS